ncbi:unnamed protein product [Ophioblennius macclurei]
MTVRFKSEYQKSFGAPRLKRTSDQFCPSLAGLRSDHMGVSREPHLQRLGKPGPVGQARSFSPQRQPPPAPKTAPPAVNGRQLDPEPPTPPRSIAEPEPPAGPRPPADPEATRRAEEAVADPEPAKPRPSRPRSQSQPSRPATSATVNEMDPELRARGQRSRGQRSEYHRQFGWKTPAAAASPMLTAEQALYSGSKSVSPFKKIPLSQETEYQRSFKGLAPPLGPRFRKHLELRRTPLFYTQIQSNKKRREESQKKPRPKPGGAHQREDTTRSPLKATPPAPSLSPPPEQVQRGHRLFTEYQSSFRPHLYLSPQGGGAAEGDAHQMRALRQQAQSYRHRAWGTNFSRDHLSQLLSEHNNLWEPVDSPTDPPTPRPESGSPSCVEALDLASNSSQRSSVAGSGGRKKTPPGPTAERRTAWGEEEEDAEEYEGRLPTPRLKMKPVQRTHHDLTTPATGGAILVGELKSADGSSPCRQRCESFVSMAAGAEPSLWTPVKQKEAWSEKVSASSSVPSPERKSPSKPTKAKPTPPLLEAPPPQHGLHGTMRHADFQHNGVLGLRLRDAPCSGGCCSDEDDRLSEMSWRSAASCSAASAVLDRALKRRDNFWGKT